LPLGAIAISLVLIQRAGQQRPGQSRTSRLLDSIGEMASNIAARLRPGTPKPAGST
jgi:hypothetical protein